MKKLSFGSVLTSLVGLSIFLVYFYCARIIRFEDAGPALRVLFISGATDEPWKMSGSGDILGFINALWSHNLYALRCSGWFTVAIAAFIFSFTACRCFNGTTSKFTLRGVLFLSGLGMFVYHPNSVVEFNHLAVFCVLSIGSIIVFLFNHDRGVPFFSKLALGVLIGIYLTVNLPSGFLILCVVLAYWYFKDIQPGSMRDFVPILLIAGVVFVIVSMGNFDPRMEIPAVKHFATSLEELHKLFGVQGNLLYMLYRVITFCLELLLLLPVLALVFFLGKWVLKSSRFKYRHFFCFLPVLLVFLAAWFNLQGVKAHQLPGEWDFTARFFAAKAIWYSCATVLPTLLVISFLLGACDFKGVTRKQMSLCLVLTLIPLIACYGSAARVLHKMQLFQSSIIFVALYLLDKTQTKLELKSLMMGTILAIVTLQTMVAQLVPIATAGGLGSFNHSLQELPGGKKLYAQQEFAEWIYGIQDQMRSLGAKSNEPVLTYDFLAVALLGLHHSVVKPGMDLRSNETVPRFGLLIRNFKEPSQSKTANSFLMRLFGPPDSVVAFQKYQEKLKEYLEANSFVAQSPISRGAEGESILYVR